ncbi:hypothetical protein BDV30DRAFT_145006 [Aspergillus minisclerotigenes]|uniref:Uncharacterized protein n=1 Tax=Aspergillus minisclerotigenes TaxID=656917 RepID=A0A5N6J0E5_9EURO|nr:hypothetical protein BDV30DRAFT_145006 [Aspergillus minisclerotigenes]
MIAEVYRMICLMSTVGRCLFGCLRLEDQEPTSNPERKIYPSRFIPSCETQKVNSRSDFLCLLGAYYRPIYLESFKSAGYSRYSSDIADYAQLQAKKFETLKSTAPRHESPLDPWFIGRALQLESNTRHIGRIDLCTSSPKKGRLSSVLAKPHRRKGCFPTHGRTYRPSDELKSSMLSPERLVKDAISKSY